jgi:antitoxin MazE
MRAQLVKIGNSRGIRLPKPVIEQAGLSDDVEIAVQDGAVIITSHKCARAGWAEAAEVLAARGEDKLLDEPVPTDFDNKEWQWR